MQISKYGACPQHAMNQMEKDIERLKADYQPVYKSYIQLAQGSSPIFVLAKGGSQLYDGGAIPAPDIQSQQYATSVYISDTNASIDTEYGWLLDPIGNLFRITGGDGESLLINYYSTIIGAKGFDGNGMYLCESSFGETSGEIMVSNEYLLTNRQPQENDLVLDIDGYYGIVSFADENNTIIEIQGSLKGQNGTNGTGIYYSSANLNTTVGSTTTISVGTISMPGSSVSYKRGDLIVGANGILGQITLYNGATLDVQTKASIKGETGQSLINVELVEELPEIGDENTIYFVPNGNTGSNQYDEYIYTDEGWEKLGTSDIDLSNYIQKSETAGLVKNDGTIDTNTYAITSQLPPTVSANPQLDGTESSLTGLQIGSSKYAISSSDLSLMPDENGWSQSLSQSYWNNGIDKTNNGYLYTPWRVASNFTNNPFTTANSIGLKNPYTDGVCLDKLMTNYLYAKNSNGGYYITNTKDILGYWTDNVRGNNDGDTSLYENYTKNILNASNNVSLVLGDNSSTFTSSGSDRLYSYDFSQDYTYLSIMPTYYGTIGMEGPVCQLRPQKAYISVRGHLFNINKQFVKLLEIPLDFIDEIDPCNATKLAEYQANDGVGTQTLIKTFKLFDETLTINVYSRVPSSLNPVVDIYIGRTNNGSSTTQNIKNVDSINISIFTKTEFVASYI